MIDLQAVAAIIEKMRNVWPDDSAWQRLLDELWVNVNMQNMREKNERPN